MSVRRIHDTPPAQEQEGEAVSQPSQPRQRKERSDKGLIKRTQRDDLILTWIGEMSVVREDQLARLLGRFAQRTTEEEGVLQLGTVNRILTRWSKAGRIAMKREFAAEPKYIWLTDLAQRQLELPYKKAFNPDTTLWRHYHLVNEARLYVEEKYKDNAVWTSERELRYRKMHTAGHYPDGLVTFSDGEIIAIEVERSGKESTRGMTILEALAEQYDNVTYFVTPHTKASVEKRIAALPRDTRESFQIIVIGEEA